MERKTRQREAIMHAVESVDRPLSPQELLVLAQREIGGLGIATIYRAIKELTKEGWLAEVGVPSGQPRYERSAKEHHHHFHCRGCDSLFEMTGCPGNLRAMTPRGFHMESHEIIINGLCASCADHAPT